MILEENQKTPQKKEAGDANTTKSWDYKFSAACNKNANQKFRQFFFVLLWVIFFLNHKQTD